MAGWWRLATVPTVSFTDLSYDDRVGELADTEQAKFHQLVSTTPDTLTIIQHSALHNRIAGYRPVLIKNPLQFNCIDRILRDFGIAISSPERSLLLEINNKCCNFRCLSGKGWLDVPLQEKIQDGHSRSCSLQCKWNTGRESVLLFITIMRYRQRLKGKVVREKAYRQRCNGREIRAKA